MVTRELTDGEVRSCVLDAFTLAKSAIRQGSKLDTIIAANGPTVEQVIDRAVVAIKTKTMIIE